MTEHRKCTNCGLNMIKAPTGNTYCVYPPRVEIAWWCELCQTWTPIISKPGDVDTEESRRRKEWLEANPGADENGLYKPWARDFFEMPAIPDYEDLPGVSSGSSNDTGE